MSSSASINKDYIEARIRETNDIIQMLEKLTSKTFRELSIYEQLAMRYLVIQLVEAASSICVHILLQVFNERVDGFPECFIRLGDKEVIPTELASRLASAARLRNLLVHRYWVIVDEKVYESVKSGINDFKDFIIHIRHFLAGS